MTTPASYFRAVRSVLALLLSASALVAVVPPPAGAAVSDPCGPAGNEISCENALPGSPPSQWEITGAGSTAIQGFSTEISTNVGGRVDLKIDTDAAAYTVDIYRTGWYGGLGARHVASVTPSASLPQVQPPCITDVTTELYDCGNWAVSASWTVPQDAVSGVYLAVLEIPSTGARSHVTFVVRDETSDSDVVFQTSDPTWQAYNTYGGSDFYQGGANGRAFKVSYNRPVLTRGGIGGRDFYFANEYPLVRFLERNGYDVSYLSGIDTARSGGLLLDHEVFLSVGHDEYWSGAQRAHVEAARDAGVDLQFLSGNEVYWRTRHEPSADASHTPYRTLVSYKETWARAKIDPDAEWTGTWRDPRYAPPEQGAGRPENALTGQLYQVNHDDLALQVNAEEGRTRLWRDTGLAALDPGSTTTLAPHTVGYESDEDLDNGYRPEGQIRLSTTIGPTPEYLTDFGNTTVPGTTTHHLTLHRADSGALVFGAGTVQWTWGLDATHDSPFAPEPADPRMQQAQVNLLADMGAQPTTLMSSLRRASASSDVTAPTVEVTSPAEGTVLLNGTAVTVTGTADDVGGVVAGVEVSTDAGGSWHPATGTTSWSYTYTQHGVGDETVRVRAIDDSVNVGDPVTHDVAVSCPCTVYGDLDPEAGPASDTGASELGLRFTPDEDGYVTGVRFHKRPGNGGTHVGSLWSAGGTRLARATFTGESASGWQSVTFASAVPVVAGQTYVASYTAPVGRYTAEPDAFSARPLLAPPLRVAGGYGAPPAGVFAGPGAFPSRTSRDTAYLVDPVFSLTDTSPLVLVDQTPLAGSTTVPRARPVTATFSAAVNASTIRFAVTDSTGAPVAGTTTYDAATRTATFTPSTTLAGGVRHDVTVTAISTRGDDLSGETAWSFTTAEPAGADGVCPCSLFADETVPSVLAADDDSAVTLGVRVTPSVNGTVTALRFYKGPDNSGPHTGTLWSADGDALASGTFVDESTQGWQTLVLDTPVPVTAGTTYTASYRAPAGRYSATPGAFSTNRSRPPLTVGTTAGVYTYGTGAPTNATATSYLVDVVLERAAGPLAVVSQDPPGGALDVPRGSDVSVTFSTAIRPGATLSATVGGSAVAGTTTLDADQTTLSFRPAVALPAGTLVGVSLSGVRSTGGATLPTQTWSFTTTGGNVETLFGDDVPAVPVDGDSSPVELGTAFTPTRDGVVRALRFLKGAGNGGTHVGSLWGPDGTRLARVTFTGESATGWQRAALATPVRITAGTTYVVSYLAPQGHYSYTPGYFAGPVTSGSLTAPAGENGRYLYGAAGGQPRYSYGSTAYFADVEVVADAPSVGVTDRTPTPGATGVPRDTTVSVTFSAPVTDTAALSLTRASTPVPGTTSLSVDRTTLRFTPTSDLPADTEVTASLAGVRGSGGGSVPDGSWTFRTEAATTATTVSLLPTQTPAVPDVADGDAVELGVAFVPSVAGSATAIRFYKGAGNTGTHVGSLWSADGTRLASVTFTGETATGWQTATLPTPVALTPGSTYVVSYLAPRGHYSATGGFFAAGHTSGPLSVPAGTNGRYRYGSAGGFPSTSYNATNYFVDVVFRY